MERNRARTNTFMGIIREFNDDFQKTVDDGDSSKDLNTGVVSASSKIPESWAAGSAFASGDSTGSGNSAALGKKVVYIALGFAVTAFGILLGTLLFKGSLADFFAKREGIKASIKYKNNVGDGVKRTFNWSGMYKEIAKK